MTRNDPQAANIDADNIIGAILSASSGLLLADGLPARSLIRNSDALRTAGEQRGHDVVVLDVRSASGHAMERMVRAYLQRVDDAEGLSPETMRLAEAVEQPSMSTTPTLKLDAVARLWTLLLAQRPAIVFVIGSEDADESDLDALRHFARFVYSDPLAELAPESEAWERPDGYLVFVGTCPFELDIERVEFGEETVAAIRDYLNRDDVVRRFLATTDGDVARLGELVERLPQNAQHLALYRYDSLAKQEQAIVRVLAAAVKPVAPEHLHDAVALLGVSEFFARSLRSLEEAGFIRKSMGDGRIVVTLEDASFGSSLLAQIDDEQRKAAHLAFADAELARHENDPDVELLARHYAAAEKYDVALEYGARAVARLERRREFSEARRLATSLLPHAPQPQRDRLALQLAGTLESLGDYRAALDACAAVTPEETAGRAALALRRGRLLSRMGDFHAALKLLEDASAEEAPDAIRRDALLARSDAAYSVGEHDDAVAQLRTLLEEFETAEMEPSIRDRATISARNTLGKIAIVRNEFQEAVDHFEANRELSSRWGWDDEISRAQANLGVVALQRDDHGEALDRLQHALQASGSRGSLPRAYCLMNLASVYQRKGDFARALDHCLEAMRCARKVGDQTAYVVSARNLATIYQDLGAYDRAVTIVEMLRDEYENSSSTLSGGWNMFVRGHLALETGKLDEAQEVFDALLETQFAQVFGTQTRVRLAEIHHQLGHDERARELLAEAESGTMSRAKYRGLSRLLKAEILLPDDPEEALLIAREVHDLLVQAGTKNEPVRAKLAIARALVELGRESEAKTELERALGRVREIAEHVPTDFEQSYWRKPLHRQLVQRLQEFDADVPAECVASEEENGSESRDVDARSAEFWQWRSKYSEIVGEDPRLHQIFRLIDKVAASDATILVYGESGTGKELVASALHRRSMRAGKPFVKVNCAAFVENLLLSELFGHEKGAFTGASEQKIGRFEMADGGTIFLDEIGDISPNTQVALLRVLQEGTFERVGGSETQKTNVRVVCATNKNLEEMVRRGEFRLDLYYRLKGVVLELPALRERRPDIARLANHFAATATPDKPKRFSADALQFLASYTWPGNVRELQNFVRSILLFVDSNVVELEDIREFSDFFVSGDIDPDLPAIDIASIVEESDSGTQESDDGAQDGDTLYAFADPADALVEKIVAEGRSLSDIKKKLESECIKRALIQTGGNVTQAADILQMKRPRLSQIINADDALSELKARLTG